LNAPGGSISISGPIAYNAGQVYPVSVTVSRTGLDLFGLGFEALRSTGANAGTLAITNPAETQIKVASVGGNLRNNVVHQQNGGASVGSHTFSFNWTAPTTNVGDVTFYAAGNASNNNGSASGDFIYTTSQVVSFATGLGNEPSTANPVKVYPNPFQDKIQMVFSLSEPGLVQINLYSFQGKFLKQIVSELFATGEQQVTLSMRDEVRSGIYLLELSADGTKSTRKIVKL
jgi:hypothetical protein